MLACAIRARGAARSNTIKAKHPSASVRCRSSTGRSEVDPPLRRCRAPAPHTALHGLLNNAGFMGHSVPAPADGFEMQSAPNHLGHSHSPVCCSTACSPTSGARVVTVSSNAHKFAPCVGTTAVGARLRKWFSYSRASSPICGSPTRCNAPRGGQGRSDQRRRNPGYGRHQPAGRRAAHAGLVDCRGGHGGSPTVFAQNAAMGAMPTL